MGKTMIGSLNTAKKMFGTVEIIKEVLNGSIVYQKQASENYIVFSSPDTFTLNVVDNIKYWDGTLEYSTDTTTWNTWDGTTTLSSSDIDTTKYLYLRGSDNTIITGSSASNTVAKWVLTGSNISCDGNIENLLDYRTVANNQHPTMGTACFRSLFYSSILLTSPRLPATNLSESCYEYMFTNCTNLTTAPELPATTLANYCYKGMFTTCQNLTVAPELPALTMTEGCYREMFLGCSSLTVAPELPATTLAIGCYREMFGKPLIGDSPALQSLPELSAASLPQECYYKMFDNNKWKYTVLDLTDVTTLQNNDGVVTGLYGSLYYIGCAVKFGVNLQTINQTPFKFAGISSESSAITYTVYFEHTSSDTVLFTPADIITSGANKRTYTYDIYTDNVTIKDGVLTKADTYTIVNVYHLDGTSW